MRNPVERRDSEHTIARSTRWRLGPFILLAFRTPPEGVDPYDVGFDQHDAANYSETVWTIGVMRPRWEIMAKIK